LPFVQEKRSGHRRLHGFGHQQLALGLGLFALAIGIGQGVLGGLDAAIRLLGASGSGGEKNG
jgi:hypothetical protein